MIPRFVELWEQRKPLLREELTAKITASELGGYEGLVRTLVRVVLHEYRDAPDPERITYIDHGDYQGTAMVVVFATGYQPSTAWVAKIEYGSCSHCDTLQSALDSKTPVDDVMTLALHIVQSFQVIQ